MHRQHGHAPFGDRLGSGRVGTGPIQGRRRPQSHHADGTDLDVPIENGKQIFDWWTDPIKYASLYEKNEDGEVTARAEVWGIEGTDPYEPIKMTRYYAAQRTFWVDPVTGTIVKAEEHANHYYARDPRKPEAAVVDYKVTSSEQTVEAQVAAARAERDRVALWSRILPISLGSAGLVALVGGAVLGFYSTRVESALREENEDDIDIGLFGKDETGPMPAAQAPTEKIPTRRAELPPSQG